MADSICEHIAAGTTELPTDNAAARISEGLDLLVEEMHPLGNVVQAFRDLLVERARLKAELTGCPVVQVPAPDRSRFERGVPLSSLEDFIDSMEDTLWIAGAERLIPVMENSFPKIKEELHIIGNELSEGRLNPRTLLKASLTGNEGENTVTAFRLKITPQSLAFALGQIAKPIMERISTHFSLLVENLAWGKGYCPLCGTMPELAFLQGEGGQRWLRCASCSYEWRFTRLMCPFCENENQEDFEVYYVAGREDESLNVCTRCKRYVPTLDQRNRIRPVTREIAAMALMHLDVIAQQKGFLPVAVCAWNIVRERDVFSASVQV